MGTADICKNYGKNENIDRWCSRCKNGNIDGCADYRTEGITFEEAMRMASVNLVMHTDVTLTKQERRGE